ncbi:hypothetical protein ND861_14935 [Leptospira sp. 2 VSF19]|uniref:Uncharacterized protein n=1 Tax=Leptospira soteropolitanensis TaxID=2950025 RepID=A0AAW5VPH7_9LEPT|nr:hypothetical protein [Leptospira soteropolitanensis]MCW7493857.1 hypothetical protein [Leptospira soteropolitanensis]MCW7501452.1 hypothetical protein [Leptospira soteropolitanensis]MCW7523785.1 hypothetical protein [Leptospira soteropolitanensis]MCW7527650.1 hypothetical protein [Leptospira soteropolitanensis]MCW7531503.1 hypothetical protein [Leptospira soteropolitanensis]
MRKFPKTLNASISLEHLPMTERDLKQICFDWETRGFSFLRPAVVLDWKTEPLPLGHSRLELESILSLGFWESLYDWFFPKHFFEYKKDNLTKKIRNELFSQKIKTKPNSIWIQWKQIWNSPVSLIWFHLGYIKLRMDLDLEPNLFPNASPLSFEGDKKLYFRTGYLKTIHYRLTKKEFKPPYPKFAEVYIKTRDKHSDESLGKVFYTFLGYLLEKSTDEYLLSYWGFDSTLPESIRTQIPSEIWNFTISPTPSLWKEDHLFEKELEFRTVYPVSTSSQNHPR